MGCQRDDVGIGHSMMGQWDRFWSNINVPNGYISLNFFKTHRIVFGGYPAAIMLLMGTGAVDTLNMLTTLGDCVQEFMVD